MIFSSGTFIDYVNKYKDHGAILLWELGNEYNYHPEWFEGDIKNWYHAMNSAAQRIHENDPSHPVTTAHGELPDSLAMSLSNNIDVWGMNVYRFDDPTPIFSEWKAISTKPMYLSEAGGDSYMSITKDGYEQGYNENAQADANEEDPNHSPQRNRDMFWSGHVLIYRWMVESWESQNTRSRGLGSK